MPEDVALTRRRRMLAFLVEQGGSGSLADANAFSEGKLLAAHQAFSAIMEGIVDGGFATWDGTTFTVTDAGRAEAALAPQPRRRRGAAPPSAPSVDTASDAVVAPATDVPPEPPPEPPPSAGHSHAHAHEDTPSHGPTHAHGDDASHDHDHAHAGGHSHAHGHAGRSEPPVASRPRPGTRPQATPPRAGVRARILGFIRGLLRGR